MAFVCSSSEYLRFAATIPRLSISNRFKIGFAF